MATLTSASTDAEVKDAYDDNASYAEDSSASKARTFVLACRILLRRLPLRAGRGDHQVDLFLQSLQKELERASAWLGSGGGTVGGGVVYPNFDGMRG